MTKKLQLICCTSGVLKSQCQASREGGDFSCQEETPLTDEGFFILNNQVGSMNEAADSVDKSGPPKYAPNHAIRRVNQGTSCMNKRLFSKAWQAMLHLDLPGPHLNECSHAIIVYIYY